MLTIGEFERRFREILDRFDGICAQTDGDVRESLEELNAEFEDALIMLSEIGESGEDAREELRDAMEEFVQLCADYRRLAGREPSVALPADRLERLVSMATGNP